MTQANHDVILLEPNIFGLWTSSGQKHTSFKTEQSDGILFLSYTILSSFKSWKKILCFIKSGKPAVATEKSQFTLSQKKDNAKISDYTYYSSHMLTTFADREPYSDVQADF